MIQELVDEVGQEYGAYSPSTQQAITAIVSAEGNLDLAAERLFGTPVFGQPHPKTRLIALLATDEQAQVDLQRVLRSLTMLQAFSTFKLVAVSIDGSLDTMEASVRARLFKNLLDSIAILTDDHTQNIRATTKNLNVSLTDSVMAALPREVRDALHALLPGQPLLQPGESGNQPVEDEWSLTDPPPNAALGE